jgi:HSP20 family protein
MFFTRWTPRQSPMWNQINDLQSEMNRLFDRWGERGRNFLGLVGYPAVNLWEEPDALHLEAELPGMDLKDLEIFVTGHNQLTIKGERKAPEVDKGVQHRQERGFGTFVRALTLPVPVDENQIDARFENGVLKLRMPKHEGAKPRKIEIKS